MAKFKIATPSVSGQTTWAPYKLTKTVHLSELSGLAYDEIPLTWDGSYDVAETIFQFYMPFVTVMMTDGDDDDAYSEVNAAGPLVILGSPTPVPPGPPRSFIVEMRCIGDQVPWIVKFGGYPATFGTGYAVTDRDNEGQKANVIVHAIGYGV